jgi:hypothetical protein
MNMKQVLLLGLGCVLSSAQASPITEMKAGDELMLASLGGAHHMLGAPVCGTYANPNGGLIQTLSGVYTASGRLRVDGGVLRTVNPINVSQIEVTSDGLLCMPWSWAPANQVSLSVEVLRGWAPPVQVDGVANLSAGCVVNVSGTVTRWPLRVIDAGELIGGCAAGAIPPNSELVTEGGVVELRRAAQ